MQLCTVNNNCERLEITVQGTSFYTTLMCNTCTNDKKHNFM